MDTTVMEYTAEDLIAHKLQRAGILVAKPKFDQNGADLLALLSVHDGAKFCRIQCKGRSLARSPTATVRLPEAYVTDGLVVFIFVETGESEATHLFCFLANDIRSTWQRRHGHYVISLSRARLESELEPFRFSDEKARQIVQAISAVDVKREFERLLSAQLEVVEKDDALVATSTLGPSTTTSSGN